jgi:putative DNA primase/helicase
MTKLLKTPYMGDIPGKAPDFGAYNLHESYGLSHGEILTQFIKAMRETGIEPQDSGDIVADGSLSRFHIIGDKPGTKNGYATLHLDGIPAGSFGSWKLGISQTWRAGASTPMTPQERLAIFRKIEQDKARRALIEQNKHTKAARLALGLWENAMSARSNHPYLVRKGITPGNAHQQGDALMLPIVGFHGRMAGLQFIQPDGTKRMLAGTAKRGNFIPCSMAATAARVLICEGWATGRSLAEMEPDSIVLAAIDAGNLEPVAVAARRRWQTAEIVICCDFDEVGRAKGLQAARAAGAVIMQPPEGLPPEITDWNDWAAMCRPGGAS